MLSNINHYDLIFLDIETVPQFSSLHEQLSSAMKELWAIKHSFLKTENETPEEGIKNVLAQMPSCKNHLYQYRLFQNR